MKIFSKIWPRIATYSMKDAGVSNSNANCVLALTMEVVIVNRKAISIEKHQFILYNLIAILYHAWDIL